MLSKEDVKQIALKGISEEQIETQLKQFRTGFPFLKLEAAAGIGQGILSTEVSHLCFYPLSMPTSMVPTSVKPAILQSVNAC